MKTRGKAKSLGEAEFYPINSLADDEISRVIKDYRRQVAGRYQAVTEDNIGMVLLHSPFQVSPKVDGELWFLVAGPDGAPALCSTNGRVITGSLPLLDEAAEMLGKLKQRVIMAGELYVLAPEGRPRVGMVSSILADGKGAEVERLGFMAFDLVEAEEVADEYTGRLETLKKLAGKGKRCQVIKTEECEDVAAVQECYETWVESGKAEGLVVRDAVGNIAKMKPSFSFDVAVVAFTDRREFPDQVVSVLMGLRREDGSYQLVGGCGNLGKPAERKALRKALVDTITDADMRHASGGGALYRFVDPQVVLEVVVTDVQAESADGSPVQNRVLGHGKNGWETLQYLPGASLLHASVVRVRDDKSTDITDVRFSQLTERCYVESLDAKAEKVDLPTSEIIRREVYTKKAKDKVAVRKLVAWKTNKEGESVDHPAYVIHFTDYSPGRKSPLNHEVRIAPDKESAEKIAEAMLEANVKKGWENVG